jgi:S1-C subfamily serine protease
VHHEAAARTLIVIQNMAGATGESHMAEQGQAADVLRALSGGMADAVEFAARSVVTVNARRRISATGVVWPGAAGVVVTSNHVIERDEDISVGLPDGTTAPATIAGRDGGSDLAVLRIEAAGLIPATLSSGEPRAGALVLAVGRPESDGITVSGGVISTVGGPWRTGSGNTVDGYLRSDTTFYPGFSGGPLVDVEGHVLGVNSSRLGRGAGLTIPVAAVQEIIEALLAGGRLKRGYLGVVTQPVRVPETLRAKSPGAGESGLMVMSVEANSPADVGGLVVGDLLVMFDGHTIAEPGDLQERLGHDRVGTVVSVSVLRGGQPVVVSITIGERA